jgi:predicted DCC family thiol-disulfide oxidoreductase YuxK
LEQELSEMDQPVMPIMNVRVERHARVLVFFDGVCNLCNETVLFIIDRDPKARFRFAPLQSQAAREVLLPLGYVVSDPPESLVVVASGLVLVQSSAALRIASMLSGPWPYLAGVARLVPRSLRDFVYRVVTRHRYRWFGRTESCRVPTPELQSRFLG